LNGDYLTANKQMTTVLLWIGAAIRLNRFSGTVLLALYLYRGVVTESKIREEVTINQQASGNARTVG